MMAFSFALFAALTHPQPFLVQGVIDSAKIIGLPRLKTMDRVFAKRLYVGEFQHEEILVAHSRKEFIKQFVQSH